MAPAEIIKSTVDARDEGKFGEILDGFNTKYLVLFSILNPFLVKASSDPQNLPALLVYRDDVRFLVIVLVQIQPGMTFQDLEWSIFVIGRGGESLYLIGDQTKIVRRGPGSFQFLVKISPAQYPFTNFIRRQIQHMGFTGSTFE